MRTLFLLLPGVGFAAPIQMQHQARLLDAAGQGIDGPVTLTVGLYADGSTPTALWEETFEVVASNGYASVVLGADVDGNPLDDGLFDGSARFVGVRVGGEALGVRQLVATVPMAVHAQMASVAEQAVTATSLAGGDVTVGGLLTLGDPGGTTCTAMGALRFSIEHSRLEICDGSGWRSIYDLRPAASADNPADSCKQLNQDHPELDSARYWIRPPGYGGAAFEAYCDMETDGGGWMLTYKMRNDSGDPWPNYFIYIDDGVGTQPPLELGNGFAGAGWYEGPSAAARWNLWTLTGGTEFRGVTYDGSGNPLMDVKTSGPQDTGNTWYCAATGCNASASYGYPNASMGTATALHDDTRLGIHLVPGQSYSVYNHGAYTCDCWEGVFIAGDYTNGLALFTDHNHSGRYLGDYTTFWIR